MSKKNQYEVKKFYGLPVENNRSGGYQLRKGANDSIKIHTWRIGKHTKGQYRQPGQLLLTENNMLVMIVAAEPLPFKDRHSEVPCQRLLTAQASPELLAKGQEILKQQLPNQQ